jgi:hypothetical protein
MYHVPCKNPLFNAQKNAHSNYLAVISAWELVESVLKGHFIILVRNNASKFFCVSINASENVVNLVFNV